MRHASLALFALLLSTAACKKEAPPPPAVPTPPPAAPAPPPAPKAPAAYAPRVEVIIDESGFVPDKIPAKAGKPLTLAITRKTEKTCAMEILFEGDKGKTELPMGKTVEVVYTPKATGAVKFGCAMGMMIGGVLDVAE